VLLVFRDPDSIESVDPKPEVVQNQNDFFTSRLHMRQAVDVVREHISDSYRGGVDRSEEYLSQSECHEQQYGSIDGIFDSSF
jgi:hypothetical protein